MKIGIDASCWANKRGYGRYTRELLHALLALDQQNDYWLFLDADTAQHSEDLPEPQRAQRVIINTSRAAAQAASASGRRSLRDIWAMSQATRSHHLDVFYFPSVYTFFPIVSRVKVTVTLHDTIAERYPQFIFPDRRTRLFWDLKVRCAIAQASLIMTVSQTAKRDIMRHFGLAEGAMRVVPDAVTTAFHPIHDASHTASILARHDIDNATRFILYVGGISPHKNLSTLIAAYTSLIQADAQRDVKLVLVGDVDQDVFFSSYPALCDTIQRLGLAQQVIFTGYVPDWELPHFYTAAQLFVLPSYDEGFGLPALEAMACGSPVVASRAGALPEVLGDAGRLFDPHSSSELRDQMLELLADEHLRKELRSKGLCRAREFSWEQSARAALSVFEEVGMQHERQVFANAVEG